MILTFNEATGRLMLGVLGILGILDASSGPNWNPKIFQLRVISNAVVNRGIELEIFFVRNRKAEVFGKRLH